MLTLSEAKEWLRVSGDDNDDIISGLIDPAYDYVATATGVTGDDLYSNTLIKTVVKFLLSLWYNTEQAEAEKLQRTIDNILKSITAMYYDTNASTDDSTE